MKISTKVLAVLMAFGVAVFAAGCGQDKKSADSKGAAVIKKVIDSPVRQDFAPVGEIKDGRKNVYVVVKTLKNSYWKEVAEGLAVSAKENDVNLYLGAALREIDWETQSNMLKELNGKKVDAVIMAATDSTQMVQSVKALKANKIPVVLIDTPLNSKDYDAAYMTNNAAAGMKVGEEMLSMLKKSGAKESEELVVRIQLSNTNSNTLTDRLAGLNSVWNEKAPKTWKLDQNLLVDKGDRAAARKMTDEALKTAKIRGIVTLNNRPTVAAAETIQKQNRKEVVLVGFDYAPSTAKFIADKNYIGATVVQNQYKMAVEAVKTAKVLAEGGKVEKKDVDTGIVVVNKINQKEYEASLKK